jgi:GTPase SAR1 family protein
VIKINNQIPENQVEILIKYLKQIKYSKRNLVEDILDPTVSIFPEGDTFEKTEEPLHNLIRDLIQPHDTNWIISLLSSHIYEQYDKTISQGQVQAILKRVLGISLTSTERSQLHELRKKVQRYEKFVNNFGEWGKKFDFPLKIIMFGLNREQSEDSFYMFNKAQLDTKNIIGVDFYTYTMEVFDKSVVQLQIWSLLDDARFEFLRKQYVKGAAGAVFVFNTTNRESFEKMKRFALIVKEQSNLKVKLRKLKNRQFKMPIAIIGLNKPDKPDVDAIPMEEIYSFTNEIRAGYNEVSSKGDIPFPDILKVLTYGIVTKLKD